MDACASASSDTMSALGTPAYMAPEIKSASIDDFATVRCDYTVDIYSAAIVAFELYTGNRPGVVNIS